MDEDEKKEMLDAMAKNLKTTFEGFNTSISDLKTDIETIKLNPPKDPTKLSTEQDIIKLDAVSQKLDDLTGTLTGFFDKITESKKKGPSFLDLLFGGYE